MGRPLDLHNQTFYRLTVLGKSNKRGKEGNVYWYCKCVCGNLKEVDGRSLVRGQTVSCGCNKLEKFMTKNRRGKTHGMSHQSIYKLWSKMLERCRNPNDPKYKDYGGRGIKADKSWYKFENFFNDMGYKPIGKSLDRKDNNGNYCKENCRWATPKEQANNSRRNLKK